ncbi:hypothetical protein C1645_737877 [Glomus cerebriforme]|uniref:Protein kinase domain-containing protein n=1 Tax=Glomus cerebriforme TaxID=658196 RepID=A0A397SW36_9GLOM|nr:hypothetical protein C1645_737877 [Glomus cerebriforme]
MSFVIGLTIVGTMLSDQKITEQQKSRAIKGLEAIHKHGILHNDIREENILINDNDDIYLIDFRMASREDTKKKRKLFEEEQLKLSQLLDRYIIHFVKKEGRIFKSCKCKVIMSSELELLKQRITELEAKNDKLEAENAELRKENTEIPDLRNKLSLFDAEIIELKHRNAETLRTNGKYNERRDAENIKLKAIIEELKSENVELRDHVTKVEQRQVLNKPRGASHNSSNDNTPSNNSSNFNSGAVHHEKPLEEKEMDSFLLEAHKKIVSSEIKQHNKERQADRKKLSKAEQASLNQNQESDTGCSTSEKIPEVSNPMTKISAGQNSHRKKGIENIVQLIADGIKDDAQSSDKANPYDVISIENLNQNSSTDSLLSLAQLFDKADDAEYGAIRANQKEILRWYYYGKEFLTQVNVIVQDGKGKIGEKKAKGIIYDKMLEQLSILRKQRSEKTGLHLPEISRKNLQKKTQKAVKIYKLFEKVGVDNIKYITTYSANSISELTNDKVQDIIDNFSKHNDNDNSDVEEVSSQLTEISAGGPGQNHVNKNHETSERIINAPPALESSEVNILANVLSAPQSHLPIPRTKPTYDRSYFCKKILDQYPNLYRECSCENFDYYGITDETSCRDYICPLCKLGHDDEEIEGEYKAESYFIKCE